MSLTVFIIVVLVFVGFIVLGAWLGPKVDKWNADADRKLAEMKATSSSHATPSTTRYSELGPAAGLCATCGREAYAIPGPVLVKLTLQDEVDKVQANAMWCLQCDTVFCMGCAHSAGGKCTACSGAVGDQYHRTRR
jgi:hypothetical protein